MKPSEIRRELLREHIQLRAEIGEAMRLAEEERDRLDAALARLSSTLALHTRHEEEVLRLVLPDIEAWGPAKTEIALAEHEKEHEALHEALARVTSSSADLGRALAELLDLLLVHMEEEEQTFLAEETLSDRPPEVTRRA